MSGESPGRCPSELLRALRDEAGLHLATLVPAGAGESGAAFWVTDHAGTVSLLKIIPEPGPTAPADLRALDATVRRPRDGLRSALSGPWAPPSRPALTSRPAGR